MQKIIVSVSGCVYNNACVCLQIRGFEGRGKAHYTPLVPELKGLHPDDVFSCIPYEKGSSFLFYLEGLLGGPGEVRCANNMQPVGRWCR